VENTILNMHTGKTERWRRERRNDSETHGKNQLSQPEVLAL